ncbi:Hypothetical protein POVR2_LOCUS263, partial [uncultured virus]
VTVQTLLAPSLIACEHLHFLASWTELGWSLLLRELTSLALLPMSRMRVWKLRVAILTDSRLGVLLPSPTALVASDPALVVLLDRNSAFCAIVSYFSRTDAVWTELEPIVVLHSLGTVM